LGLLTISPILVSHVLSEPSCEKGGLWWVVHVAPTSATLRSKTEKDTYKMALHVLAWHAHLASICHHEHVVYLTCHSISMLRARLLHMSTNPTVALGHGSFTCLHTTCAHLLVLACYLLSLYVSVVRKVRPGCTRTPSSPCARQPGHAATGKSLTTQYASFFWHNVLEHPARQWIANMLDLPREPMSEAYNTLAQPRTCHCMPNGTALFGPLPASLHSCLLPRLWEELRSPSSGRGRAPARSGRHPSAYTKLLPC
jgi:hypothetical protein